MVGDVAQRDAPLDVAEGGGERVVARARGDRRVGPRRGRGRGRRGEHVYDSEFRFALRGTCGGG